MLQRTLGAVILLALPAAAVAQAFPAKPVRLIVAQAAGSATDVIARVVTPRWGELLGQPVVVDVRPGAGGSLGTEITAKAPPMPARKAAKTKLMAMVCATDPPMYSTRNSLSRIARVTRPRVEAKKTLAQTSEIAEKHRVTASKV
jgi:tripartite-type tricarboxylate transporter receptor subunit TctC